MDKGNKGDCLYVYYLQLHNLTHSKIARLEGRIYS